MELRAPLDGTIAEAYYLQLPTGGATQGDIWINLPSGPDITKLCTGVVITPRCDIEHRKSPVVNYLPIITLERYILTVGCFSLLEQFVSEKTELLRSKSKVLGMDARFELGVPISEIEQAIALLEFPEDNRTRRRLEAAKEEFTNIASNVTTAIELLSRDELSMEQVRTITNSKGFGRLQRDIIRNNTLDTYFLPPCAGLVGEPSVVLLRHIYTCPIEQIDSSGTQRRGKRGVLAVTPPERLLRIKSPFIESLMSKLAALFTRVGTRDIPEAAAASFALPYAEDKI